MQKGNSSRSQDDGEGIDAHSDDTIYSIIGAWAENTPDAIALVSPDHVSITYRKLLSQTNSIVTSLSEIGVRRNHRVAMLLPNGIEATVAFIAVSCCAIGVPLNPAYQENELESYLSDLGAEWLMIQAGTNSRAESVAQRQRIGLIEVLTAKERDQLFTLKAAVCVSSTSQTLLQPENVALILHTSGTTAKPKRVPLTHKNLCTSAFSVRDSLALTSDDRCLGAMPWFHIHGLIGGLLSSLAAGASFVAAPNFDARCFLGWMDEFEPTWFTAVPAMHQALLRLARERSDTINPGRLRLIRSSSAPLPGKLMAEMEEVFKAPVIEAYGMTEAAHQITSNPLPPLRRKVGSVGIPTRTEVAIMDDAGSFVTGERTGEIVIRGSSVTAGYEPIGTEDESFKEGWFRTGDLGYFDCDGYLFLAGRRKEIINRGGEKISPFEIDQALLNHPDVVQAVAFAVPHPSLGEDVAAAVVVRDRLQTNEAVIRRYLSGRLASFKVPAYLLIVDDIPKSATGKIQRAAVAGTFTERLHRVFIAPKDELQMLVADIYAEVLETGQVGVGDNFFSLGGDSLRATQVISRLRSLFSIDLPIATLFSKATVAELADEIAVLVDALDENSKNAIREELMEVVQLNSPVRDVDSKN
jgi:acyl-CoA synthetase (AMP-forming)/AMP-acid ligase II/acyl carrier protein